MLVLLSFGAVYFYWQGSGIELFPSENIPATKEAAIPAQEPEIKNAVIPEPSSESASSSQGAKDSVAGEEEDLSPEEEIERAWDKEVLGHLNRLEPLQANEIYSAYLEERERYSKSLERSLEQGLKLLTNGSTPAGEERTNEEHQKRLEEIFGKHYDYLESQHQKFLDSYRDIDPKDVEKE